jgi:hypothetical protein
VDLFQLNPESSYFIKRKSHKSNSAFAKGEKMDTEKNHVHIADTVQIPTVWIRIGYFLRHYVEMLLVCCIGGFTLNFLFFTGIARVGYPNFVQQFPDLSILLIAILLAVPMLIWMRFRSHEWRPTLEMAGEPIVLGFLLITASWISIIPKVEMLPLLKGLVCPAMLIPMIIRLDLYSSNHASHQQHMHMNHMEE